MNNIVSRRWDLSAQNLLACNRLYALWPSHLPVSFPIRSFLFHFAPCCPKPRKHKQMSDKLVILKTQKKIVEKLFRILTLFGVYYVTNSTGHSTNAQFSPICSVPFVCNEFNIHSCTYVFLCVSVCRCGCACANLA